MRPDCTRGFGPVGTNGPAPIHDLPALLRDRAKGSGGDKLLEEAAAALEAAREDGEFFRWLAVHPNLYTVCDLLRADQYVTLRRACESLAAIDQARGKGVASAGGVPPRSAGNVMPIP